MEQHTFTGFLLFDVLNQLDPAFENKPILLAVTQDGQSLAAEGMRLVLLLRVTEVMSQTSMA